MSFLGSIGTIMEGSALPVALETCYGPNTIEHITSGKAVARALRAHFLVESSLTILLIRDIFFASSPDEDITLNSSVISQEDYDGLNSQYDDIVTKTFDHTGDMWSECLKNLCIALDNYKRKLGKKGRTAKLWLQYIKYVVWAFKQISF